MDREEWDKFVKQIKLLEKAFPRIFQTLRLQVIPIDLKEIGNEFKWECQLTAPEEKMRMLATFKLSPHNLATMNFLDLLNALRSETTFPYLES